jgi:hypothetical protein
MAFFLITVAFVAFAVSVSCTLGYWAFDGAMELIENRKIMKRGFSKMVGEDGQEWYVGYGD